MNSSDSKLNDLVMKYSEIQKKNQNNFINADRKKEVDNLIDSGLIFQELGMIVKENSPQKDINKIIKKNAELSIFYPESTSISPDDLVKYAKETQTSVERSSNKNSEAESPRAAGVISPKFLTALEWDDEFDISFEPRLEHENGSKKNATKARKVVDITEEEKDEVLMSDPFLDFFDRATSIMEHHLLNDTDIFTDYSGTYDDDKSLLNTRKIIDFNRELFDDRWSRNRVVTSLSWSPHHPEQLLTSYFLNDTLSHEPDGVCLVWNVKSKSSSPEHIMHYQSPIITATYAKYHNNLIVGGTYSGQIVIWDIRSSKRTPVQRTLLSAAGHTHPVINLSVIGESNAHSLLSLSTDGKVCSWRMEMLNSPLESQQILNSKAKEVNSTCMEFFQGNGLQFAVGSEDGSVYICNRVEGKPVECLNVDGPSHQGPVMSVSTQQYTSTDHECKSLFLTSSVDYSVKLWSSSEKYSPKLIFTLDDRNDYVYDVDWSPIHPTMFCNVDGVGRLEVWNLLASFEEPVAKVLQDSQAAINRCRWHDSGLVLATGDDCGRVRIYDMNEHAVQTRNIDWSEFDELINQLHFDTKNSDPIKDIM